jgi:putative N6-adenine-specific DNA methylase
VAANAPDFEILLIAAPGLEPALQQEAMERGFRVQSVIAGGVIISGGWPEVWRANLQLRGTGRVLARIGSFPAVHLSQLDKRARKFPWYRILRKGVAVHVEASCRKSKIYHAGAAAQRIATAIREEFEVAIEETAPVTIMLRIDHDLCSLSVDTSGDMLHKRGHKEAVAKAPMRETMAALLLRQCGYKGNEPVLDPMCGSGTFVVEAAEMALGLWPGRDRAFAFEHLKTFDAEQWSVMKSAGTQAAPPAFHFTGSDRDAGAIRASTENAARSGVLAITDFQHHPVSALQRPEGPPGLVMVNPPYGLRIGDKAPLKTLHAKLGEVLRQKFSGWRVGLVTADKQLAYATGLPFKPPGPPINHGGTRVFLFQTDALA